MHSNQTLAHSNSKQESSKQARVQRKSLRPALVLAFALACVTAMPFTTSMDGTNSTTLFAQTAPAKKEPAAKKADGKPGEKGKDAKDKKEDKKEPAAATKPKRESVWELIKKGGLTMVGLFIMSTIIVAFAAERFFFFQSRKVFTGKQYFADLEAALDKGGPSELRKHLQDDQRLISKILSAGLAYENEGAARVEKAIENSASVEVGNLERGLNLLSNLGNLAPLLGFFGTVVGMRISFLQFVEKAAPTARDLAGGVEEALITTAAGLLVAIPTYLIHNLFIYRIDSFNIELERCAAAILARFRS